MNTRAASAMRQGLDDEAYNSVQHYHDHPDFTDRERLAAEYALWERLRAHFSDPELLELTVTIGFCVGMGRAFQVLDIAKDFDVLWSQEPPAKQESTTGEEPA
jgi:alkylhydroperoxidase family enzyme